MAMRVLATLEQAVTVDMWQWVQMMEESIQRGGMDFLINSYNRLFLINI